MGDFAIEHVKDAVGDLRCVRVVGDHEDGLVEFAAGFAEHVEDGVGVLGIEVAGGLVGEDDGGAIDKSPGYGNALLLAAGQLVGTVFEAAFDAEYLCEVVEEGAVEFSLGGRAEIVDVVSDLDVAHCAESGQQVEALEDEADFGAAHLSALAVGELGEVDAVDQNRATGGVGETAEDVEEGGLAGARGTDDGDEFAWLDCEVNFAEGGDFEFAGAVGFAEVLSENDWLHELYEVYRE